MQDGSNSVKLDACICTRLIQLITILPYQKLQNVQPLKLETSVFKFCLGTDGFQKYSNNEKISEGLKRKENK